MSTHPTLPNGKRARSVIILADCLNLKGTGANLFELGSEGEFLLRLGSLIASGSGGRLLVCDVVAVPEGESVSAYSTAAQTRRQELERLTLDALDSPKSKVQSPKFDNLKLETRNSKLLIAPVVRVALERQRSEEVRDLLANEPTALLLLPWKPRSNVHQGLWLQRALRKPLPCDVAWVLPGVGVGDWGLGVRDSIRDSQPPIPNPQPPTPSILVPARGGPQAELSLELAQDLMDSIGAEVSVLHAVQSLPEQARANEEAPFTEFLSGMSRSIPVRTVGVGPNPVGAVSSAAEGHDLLIMGAGNEPSTEIGKFTREVAKNVNATVVAVKSRVPVGPAIRAARRRARPHVMDSETLSLLVDKWFAENTFHAEEFSDLSRLIDAKRQRGLTISLCLPTLNEENTIGQIIKVLKRSLVDDAPLLDEIVVIDSNSTDRTREIAAEMGVSVYIHQEVLPEAGPPVEGKGEALWKSLHVLKGDIIAWVDADVANIHPQFVYGLIGPLLREPRIGYVKGYYHRPIQTGGDFQHEGGGRVTELTVRPLLNLFFPLLSGLVQPLAGEYAGRREVLEKLPFFSGYGVETGLLIDLLERYGLSAIGQVNLEKRVHRNRSLADLSLTAFAIVQVILTRLETRAAALGDAKGKRPALLEDVNRSMKLIRFENDHLSLAVRHVSDNERPPIATIPAYRAAHPVK